MKKQKPLPPLDWSLGVWYAARWHAYDIGPKGLMQHDGSDGSDPGMRINKYIKCLGWAENIAAGNEEAQDIVIQLIVDDGVRSRGHRKNIFSDKMKTFGSYTWLDEAKIQRPITVLDYSE